MAPLITSSNTPPKPDPEASSEPSLSGPPDNSSSLPASLQNASNRETQADQNLSCGPEDTLWDRARLIMVAPHPENTELFTQWLAELVDGSGFSATEISERTHIPPKYLQCILSGRFDELPYEALARGFTRAIAGLITTDTAPILAAYRACYAPQVPSLTEITPITPPSRLDLMSHLRRLCNSVFSRLHLEKILENLINPLRLTSKKPALPRSLALFTLPITLLALAAAFLWIRSDVGYLGDQSHDSQGLEKLWRPLAHLRLTDTTPQRSAHVSPTTSRASEPPETSAVTSNITTSTDVDSSLVQSLPGGGGDSQLPRPLLLLPPDSSQISPNSIGTPPPPAEALPPPPEVSKVQITARAQATLRWQQDNEPPQNIKLSEGDRRTFSFLRHAELYSRDIENLSVIFNTQDLAPLTPSITSHTLSFSHSAPPAASHQTSSLFGLSHAPDQ